MTFSTAIQQLGNSLVIVPVLLKQVDEEQLIIKPNINKWSKKEILGHLVDSAMHNLQRLSYAKSQKTTIKPYPQDHLVAANLYQLCDFQSLIDLWLTLNKQFHFLAKNLTSDEQKLELNTTTQPVTVAWLIIDYVKHLNHHLNQVFGDDWQTKTTNSLGFNIHVEDARDTLKKVTTPFVALNKHGSLSVELYAPKEKDLQTPHEQDEIYVIIQGYGKFQLEEQLFDFKPHDVIFVPAGAKHRFTSFTEEFETWVIFYGPKGGEKAKQSLTWQKDEFKLTTNQDLFDQNYIHSFLTNSYWATGRSAKTVASSTANSLSFGLFDKDEQIGFARVITDYNTFAYLADVFVDKKYQGKGLGKWMIEQILSVKQLNTCNWLLKTLDAQNFYKQIGFKEGDSTIHILEFKP